jgi:hypothetical protein
VGSYGVTPLKSVLSRHGSAGRVGVSRASIEMPTATVIAFTFFTSFEAWRRGNKSESVSGSELMSG